MIAFCHFRRAVREFMMSTIMSAKLNKRKYSISEDFDKRKFF